MMLDIDPNEDSDQNPKEHDLGKGFAKDGPEGGAVFLFKKFGFLLGLEISESRRWGGDFGHDVIFEEAEIGVALRLKNSAGFLSGVGVDAFGGFFAAMF